MKLMNYSKQKQNTLITNSGTHIGLYRVYDEPTMISSLQSSGTTFNTRGYSLVYDDSPSDLVKHTALNINPWTVQFLKNPSVDNQLLAVTQEGLCIQFLENPSKVVSIMAIFNDAYAAQFIPSDHLDSDIMDLLYVIDRDFVSYLDNFTHSVIDTKIHIVVNSTINDAYDFYYDNPLPTIGYNLSISLGQGGTFANTQIVFQKQLVTTLDHILIETNNALNINLTEFNGNIRLNGTLINFDQLNDLVSQVGLRIINIDNLSETVVIKRWIIDEDNTDLLGLDVLDSIRTVVGEKTVDDFNNDITISTTIDTLFQQIIDNVETTLSALDLDLLFEYTISPNSTISQPTDIHNLLLLSDKLLVILDQIRDSELVTTVLSYHPLFIKFIDDPLPELQLMVVQNNPVSVFLINNPTPDAITLARSLDDMVDNNYK